MFEYDTDTAVKLLEVYKSDKAQIESDILNLNKLKDCINQNKELFDKNKTNEEQYFCVYEKYVIDINTAVQQYKNSNLDISNSTNDARLTLSSLNLKAESLNTSKKQLAFLVYCIQNNKTDSLNKDNISLYYKDYSQYISNVEQIKQIEKDLDILNTELSRIKDVFLASCNQSLSELNSNISNNDISIKNAQGLIDTSSQKGFSEQLI